MEEEVEAILYLLVGGIVSILGWALNKVWSDKAAAIDAAIVAIQQLENRIDELEKSDVGVQIHLDSLHELRQQVDTVRTSILGLVGPRGNRHE